MSSRSSVQIAAPAAKHTETNRQIRGSSLLLAGRLLSILLNFAAQVLIVRYLSKTEYGAFEYALSLVVVGEAVVTLGLDRAITRFAPIYHERGDHNKLFGTILLVTGTALSLGAAFLLLFYSLHGVIFHTLAINRHMATLLLIMAALAPVQALDNLLIGMFAAFAGPRAIFFRKHVLGPCLKLGAVLVCIFAGGSLFLLAGGYLVASILGVALYTGILVSVLRTRLDFGKFDWKTLILPTREVFSFTIPLLTTDLVFTLMNASDTILLDHFSGAGAVASFRAVQPTARLNQLVLSSFALLFTPLAARMFARKDQQGINDLYWRTAVWMAVLSFPIFAATFSLAGPVTYILYGHRYADSAPILAILAAGYYFNAALGANGTTLMVFGKVRTIVLINILAVLANLGMVLWLIPKYGALGAAIGTGGALALHNLLKQIGLRSCQGIRIFDRRYLTVYAVIGVSVLALLAQAFMWHGALPLIAGAAVVSSAVFALCRKSLNVDQTFPELLRFPLARRLFGR